MGTTDRLPAVELVSIGTEESSYTGCTPTLQVAEIRRMRLIWVPTVEALMFGLPSHFFRRDCVSGMRVELPRVILLFMDEVSGQAIR